MQCNLQNFPKKPQLWGVLTVGPAGEGACLDWGVSWKPDPTRNLQPAPLSPKARPEFGFDKRGLTVVNDPVLCIRQFARGADRQSVHPKKDHFCNCGDGRSRCHGRTCPITVAHLSECCICQL